MFRVINALYFFYCLSQENRKYLAAYEKQQKKKNVESKQKALSRTTLISGTTVQSIIMAILAACTKD